MVISKGQLQLYGKRSDIARAGRGCCCSVTAPVGKGKADHVPNHFLESLALPSMTSKTPDLSDSTEGTWLARLLLQRDGR